MSLVWYHIEKDLIFEDAYLEANFFGLIGEIDWSNVEVLGEL